MKVCIVYGWSEGRWHSRHLRTMLQQAGYGITRSPSEADIIIAHSGGCYILPAEIKARLVMLIGLPLWSGKSITTSLREKIRIETKNFSWFIKTVHNTIYLLIRPIYWSKMRKAMSRKTLPEYNGVKVMVLRNEHDPFGHTDEIQELAKSKNWQFQTLPGYHDDLWENPRPYVEIVISNTST